MGVPQAQVAKLTDMTTRERMMFVPLIILVFYLGLVPNPTLKLMQPSVEKLLDEYHDCTCGGDW